MNKLPQPHRHIFCLQISEEKKTLKTPAELHLKISEWNRVKFSFFFGEKEFWNSRNSREHCFRVAETDILTDAVAVSWLNQLECVLFHLMLCFAQQHSWWVDKHGTMLLQHSVNWPLDIDKAAIIFVWTNCQKWKFNIATLNSSNFCVIYPVDIEMSTQSPKCNRLMTVESTARVMGNHTFSVCQIVDLISVLSNSMLKCSPFFNYELKGENWKMAHLKVN